VLINALKIEDVFQGVSDSCLECDRSKIQFGNKTRLLVELFLRVKHADVSLEMVLLFSEDMMIVGTTHSHDKDHRSIGQKKKRGPEVDRRASYHSPLISII